MSLDAGMPAPALRRLVATSTLVLWLLISFPFAVACAWPPAKTRFIGTFFYVDDYCQYLSFVEQASRGQLLFHNKFDPRPHDAIFLNLEWATAGLFGLALGGRPALGFHVLRLLALAALVAAIMRALARGTRDPARMMWGAALFFSAGGLGWLRLLAGERGQEFVDLRWGTFPWQQALSNPHFVTGTALLLWTVLLYVEWREGSGPRWRWLATASALALTRPFDWGTFVLLAAALAVLELIRGEAPRRVAQGLLELVWLAPVAFYCVIVLRLHPSFGLWSGTQNEMPKLLGGELAWAFAPAAALAVLGWRFPVEARIRPLREAFTVWSAIVVALLLAGLPGFASQAITTLGVALTATAVVTLPKRGLAIAVLALCPSSLLLFWLTLHPSPSTFLARDVAAAVDTLARSCTDDDLAMAPNVLNLRIAAFTPCRVVNGHRVLTPDYQSRLDEATAFYDPATPPSWRAPYLERMGATAVLVPPSSPPWLPLESFRPVARWPHFELWVRHDRAGRFDR